MNVADWQDTDESPLPARLTAKGSRSILHLENHSGHRVGKLWVIHAGGPMKELGRAGGGAAQDFEALRGRDAVVGNRSSRRDSEFQTV